MRWVYLTVIVLFVVVTAVFALQNLDMVTMSFLGFSIRAPLAVLAAVVYLLGAATGGSLFALLRKSVEAPERRRLERVSEFEPCLRERASWAVACCPRSSDAFAQ